MIIIDVTNLFNRINSFRLKVRSLYWNFMHNCIAHPLLFASGHSEWSAAFHNWTAAKWLGNCDEET